MFQTADAGDVVARRLIIRSGEEVAITATAMLRRLNLLDREADVVLGGSVFRAESPLLLQTISERLAISAPLATARAFLLPRALIRAAG